MSITIRPLTTLLEMKEVERLEQTIWHVPDLEILPMHTMHAIQHNGGLLLGAFDGAQMAGFVIGILGTNPAKIGELAHAVSRLKMYSVVAGVLPAYQGQGVGYQLKLAQRAFALEIGLNLITWTYDPLESLNGHFNLGKLGVTCQTYRRNFHGEMAGLNAGLPTDRFEVDWRIDSERVKQYVEGEKRPLTLSQAVAGGAMLINETTFTADGLPLPSASPQIPAGSQALVEIPANFQTVKQKAFDLASNWRNQTRNLFETLFQDGFVVTDFVTHLEGNGRRRSFYLLTR